MSRRIESIDGNTPRILITGATGKTGTPAIKELRQQGIAVRAMASKKDERADALTELGAEVVVANFHDYNQKQENKVVSKLKQKFGDWALVTGASSGIGEEFTRQIAAAGMNVILVARRTERLNKIASELSSKYGVETLVLPQDLTQDDCVEKIAEETAGITVDLVILNAGDAAMGGFLKRSAEEFTQSVKINVLSTMKLAHHFLGKMYAKKKRGGLMFVSSGVAVGGAPYVAEYSAFKAYQMSLGQGLHHELMGADIHVSVLMPGPTKTEAFERDDIDFNKMPMPPGSPVKVVRVALKGLIKNKQVIIPGFMNKMMDFMIRKMMSRWMISKMFAVMMKGLIAPKYRY